MNEAQYTQYYVAFLDILGFKNLVNDPNISCQDILDTYKFVGYRHREFFGKKYKYLRDSIKMKIMSDSICLYIEVDTPNALFLLIAYCVTFQRDLLVRDPSVFIRGGITMGEMYVEEDVMYGPALTEAYLLEEKNAKVPRIIIRKSTVDYGMNQCDTHAQAGITAGIFRDDDAFYAINYFDYLTFRTSQEVINRIKETISDKLDTTIDESIRQKYLYVDKNLNRYTSEIEEISNA